MALRLHLLSNDHMPPGTGSVGAFLRRGAAHQAAPLARDKNSGERLYERLERPNVSENQVNRRRGSGKEQTRGEPVGLKHGVVGLAALRYHFVI